MLVSAHVRPLDYSTRSPYSKKRRRSPEDDPSISEVDEDRREDAAQQRADSNADEDDDTLEYSRVVTAQAGSVARRDMVSESAHPAPALHTTALWSLIGTINPDGPSGPAVEPATRKPSAGRGDAFYDLLDQVIAKV